MTKDYYIVLGVSRGADLNRIKRAYRTLAKRLHPDLSRCGGTTDRFLEAQEAYDTLADEKKRRRYDEELEKQGVRVRIEKPDDSVGARRTRSGRLGPFFGEVDDFSSGFLPGLFDLHKGRLGAKDLYFEAVLSPDEAAGGGLYTVTLAVSENCPRCTGAGAWEGFYCPLCHGSGRVPDEREFSLPIPPHVQDGAQIAFSLEGIGLRNTRFHIVVTIDPDLG